MRTLLRRLGARTGISLGLIVVVAVVVIVGRIVDEGRRSPVPGPQVPGALPTVPATEGDDSVHDDSVEEDEPGSFPDDEAVLAAATGFATAWLRRDLPADLWLDGLRPHATEDLVARLAGVDPLAVPADAALGLATIDDRSESYADVLVPIAPFDALALGLVNPDGVWLVGTVDREIG